jgi:hypothetical protein
MIIHRLYGSILITALFLIIYSCGGNASHTSKNSGDFKDIQIVINSPYACYNEINLTGQGRGTSSLSFRDSDDKTTPKKKKEFVISSAEINQRILSLVSQMESRSPVSTSRRFDEYHFVFKIDNKTYIDRFGHDSLLDVVLTTLKPFAILEDSGQCDYFNMVRR